MDFGLIFSIVLFSAFPVERTLQWIYAHTRRIYSQLEVPYSYVYMSKLPFLAGFSKILTFFQGYLVVYALGWLASSDFVMACGIGLAGIGFMLPTGSKKDLPLFFWGGFMALSPLLGIIFPIGYAIFTFIFNSLDIGLISALLVMIPITWGTLGLFELVFAVFFWFASVLIARHTAFFSFLDGEWETLYQKFQNR